MAITNPPSANMGIVTPVVLGEVGPLWASELNTALATTVDAHDHTTGKGVQVPTAGININAALDFNSFGLDAAGYYGFTARALPAGALPVSLFTVVTAGVTELWYEDDTGRDVQLTNAGTVGGSVGVNKGFVGNYDSTPGTGTAAAYYDQATSTFAFYRTTGPAYDTSAHAGVRVGTLLVQQVGASISLREAAEGTATGGWKLTSGASPNPSFTMALYNATAGYLTAMDVPQTVRNQAALNMNGSTGTGITYRAFGIGSFGATGRIVASTIAAHSNGGTPVAGFGSTQYYYATVAADVGSNTYSATPSLQGAMSWQWLNIGTRAGGVLLEDALGGAINAAPVLASNGVGGVGILTTPSAVGLTVGGRVQANDLIPTASTYAPGIGGFNLKSQVLAWGAIDAANTFSAGYNVASVSWSVGTCTVTLSNALNGSAITCIVAMERGSSTTGFTVIHGRYVNTTTLEFMAFGTTNLAAPTFAKGNTAFNFIMVGDP